jgi:hypothetical protein
MLLAGSLAQVSRDGSGLGIRASIAGIGGALAVARGYWASSTRKVRERISVVMNAISQTLAPPETRPPGSGRSDQVFNGPATW